MKSFRQTAYAEGNLFSSFDSPHDGQSKGQIADCQYKSSADIKKSNAPIVIRSNSPFMSAS